MGGSFPIGELAGLRDVLDLDQAKPDGSGDGVWGVEYSKAFGEECTVPLDRFSADAKDFTGLGCGMPVGDEGEDFLVTRGQSDGCWKGCYRFRKFHNGDVYSAGSERDFRTLQLGL